MSNDLNYSFIQGFSNSEPSGRAYRSPSSAGFNPNLVEGGGPMWAAAVMYLTGQWLDLGNFDNCIWGNLDEAAFAGWALRIIDNRATSGTVDLVGSYGDGAAVNSVGVPLSIITPTTPDGPQLGRGVVERLICVAMTLEAVEGGVTLRLFINGQLVAESIGGDAYAASAQKVSMGTTPANGEAAGGIFVNSVGYKGPSSSVASTNGNASTMFRIAREKHSLGFIRNDTLLLPEAGLQATFDHLYLASDAAGGSGSIIDAAQSYRFVTFPSAAASLADAGGGAVVDDAPAPVALETQDAGLTVTQIANCDWYDGYQSLDLTFDAPPI